MAAQSISLETYLSKAMTYTAYMALIKDLLSENKTTGPNQSEDLVAYTRFNFQRMERLNKTIVLQPALIELLNGLKKRWTWLVITEAWCGDAAQNIPLLHAISVSSKGKIDIQFVLRDENLELIDQHLTNGGRAIPMLLNLETDTLNLIGKWGPRPKEAQELVNAYKQNPVQSMETFSKELHAWYAKNKTIAMQQELIALIKKWGK